MALINRAGGSLGIRPKGTVTSRWSCNTLSLGSFVTLSRRDSTLRSGLVSDSVTELSQPSLQGYGCLSRSPDGTVVWNLTGHSTHLLRLERIGDSETGSFRYLTLIRSNEAADRTEVNGTVLALSADTALVMEGTADRYTGFKLVRHSGGSLTQIASGVCADHPARPDWIALPGADENSFFYLSRDRYLMEGTVSGSGITFTVADGSTYLNREPLYHATEEGCNALCGARMADGSLLVCWNRVNRILTSGQEQEEDPELGTLYWPYETYTYDVLLSLLDKNGTPLDTVTLAQEVSGALGTRFAGPLAQPLLLADGRAAVFYNLRNDHAAQGRAAWLVSAENGKLVLADAPEVFLQEHRWEKLAAVGSDSILARVTAWGDTGTRSKDRFRPQLTYYRMTGDKITELYSADCLGEAQTADQSGSYTWSACWSAAGRTLVFGGRWSGRPGWLIRLVARWDSGYRTGLAGESYAGLCLLASDGTGAFGLCAPEET